MTGPTVEEMLELARVEFENTGNPLCAWEAIAWASDENLPVPTWVQLYLAAVADQLFDIHRHSRNARAAALMRALGFAQPGRGRKLDAFDSLVPRWKMLAGDVRNRREAGETYQAARDSVPRTHGVSWSVVDRACRAAKRDPSFSLLSRRPPARR